MRGQVTGHRSGSGAQVPKTLVGWGGCPSQQSPGWLSQRLWVRLAALWVQGRDCHWRSCTRVGVYTHTRMGTHTGIIVAVRGDGNIGIYRDLSPGGCLVHFHSSGCGAAV